MAFGQEIRRLRQGAGLTAPAMAKLLGVDNLGRYKSWEQKNLTPKYEDRQTIEEVFGMEMADILALEKLPKNLFLKIHKQRPTLSSLKAVDPEAGISNTFNVVNVAAEQTKSGIPIFDVPVDGEFLEHYRDTNYYQPVGFLNIPKLRNCDFAAIISGNSMAPLMKSGSIAVCRILSSLDYFEEGEMYFVVTANGFETVKFVQNGDNPDELKLTPHDEKIKPSIIKKNMVLKMCIVDAWLNFR